MTKGTICHSEKPVLGEELSWIKEQSEKKKTQNQKTNNQICKL